MTHFQRASVPGDVEATRELNLMLAEADDGPMGWWILSFTDPELPNGQQHLGTALVEARNEIMAMQRTWDLGINPGGQISIVGPILGEHIPPEHRPNELLQRADIDDLDRRIREREERVGDVRHGTCTVCGGGCRYQDCPTGGWWIHDHHPDDDHDAEVTDAS